MTSVALLSHRFGNIGHSFMALGAEEIVRAAFGADVQITHFEQHHPFSIYPRGDWLSLVDRIPHGRLRWLRRRLAREEVFTTLWPRTKPLPFDLAVACGGPNLVPGASGRGAPELRILLHHFNGAFHHHGVPLVDAGVGSAFPLSRVPEALDPDDAAFYTTALSYLACLTVRDTQAQRIFRQLGADPPILPCMAIASGRAFEAVRDAHGPGAEDKAIVINFQAKGSNTDWGQGVDADWWMDEVRGVIADLRAMGERIVLLCHAIPEQRLAQQLAPDLPAMLRESEAEYVRIIAGANVGFVSRIHAAVALAGIGVPSVVVGNDTRTGTTAEMGLPSLFTRETSRVAIVEALRQLMGRLDEERERLIALREATIDAYAKLFIDHARS
ncbi:MAG: polysaccharide pyruvyl transferase family protein [Rhodospirillaceae bacterium]|nr:polysaccharide pyruvyl transferase family protein [Rhodospirillaceae bacterium]